MLVFSHQCVHGPRPGRRALCGTISEFRKVKFTVSAEEIPSCFKKIPSSVAQGILLQASEFARVLAFKIGIGLANSMEFPVIFPVSREFASRDEFESDCVRRQYSRPFNDLQVNRPSVP